MPRQTITCTAVDEVEFVLEADYLPYRPAITSGPPERCSPEEPAEVEVTRLVALKVRVLGPYKDDGRRTTLEHTIALRDETLLMLQTDLLNDGVMLAMFVEAVLDKGSE